MTKSATDETTSQSHTTHEVQIIDGLFCDGDYQLSVLCCHPLQGSIEGRRYA